MNMDPEAIDGRLGPDHAALEFLIRIRSSLLTRTYISNAECAEVLDESRAKTGQLIAELRESSTSPLELVDTSGSNRRTKYRFDVRRGRGSA